MVERSAQQAILDAECAVWCRYLIDQLPSAQVLARYGEAHVLGVVSVPGHASRFDRALVRFACFGRFATRLADTHARLLRPAGLLRRKLVLTLALLETDARHHARVDLVSPGSPVAFLLHCVLQAFAFALLALVGLLLFLPLRLACSLSAGPKEAA